MEKYYLTKERLLELQVELRELKTTRRAQVAERLKQSKEYGDLSENSEYTEARDEQSKVESRILELEDILKKAIIIRSADGSGVVRVGSVVVVQKNGESVQYRIVGSEETRPEAGMISNESPIGRAFLDHKVGDSVTVTTPAGRVVYQITKVE